MQIMRRFIRRMRPGAVGIWHLGAAGTGTLGRKPRSSSSRSRSPRCGAAVLMAVLFLAASTGLAAINLTPAETRRIGNRIWQNECGGTREGLTSWNMGENFASLGIGHFIWYPKGVNGPFEESFPSLVRFFAANGVKLPAWLKAEDDCPWNTRAEFLGAAKSEKMNELRDLLASTIQLQARFLAQRMEASLPKMLESAPKSQHAEIKSNFE